MPLSPLTGVLGQNRAAHLLRRATFGATRDQINSFAGLTAGQAVAQLFNANLPDAPLPLNPETGQTWAVTGPPPEGTNDREQQGQFKRWLLGQMLNAGVEENLKPSYSLREKITFFLHTHFTSMVERVNNSRASYFQNALFRYFAFDSFLDPELNFTALVKKVTADNAMLIFLDGNTNVKGSPNENYAREMFELYTIGRGLEGFLPPTTDEGDYINFTEQDVQAAARVLTGIRFDNTFSNIDPDTMLPRGTVNAGNHETDASQKTFSARFDGAVIDQDPLLLEINGDPSEESVLDEVSRLIDLIYTREESARHVCRKLYRYFVYYFIDDTVDEDIVASMAETFVNSGYKIQPVLEELFNSEHFYEAAVGNQDDKFGGIIKSPLDLVVGTLNFFQMELPDYETQTADFYDAMGNLLGAMDNQGMNFYDPFEVAGYAAYHQFPVYNRNWISTNYLTRRYEFIQDTFIGQGMMEEMMGIDIFTFTKNNIPNNIAEIARGLVIEYCTYLLPYAENLTFDADNDDDASITAERLNYFLQVFLGEIDQDPEGTWTFRWNNPVDDETVSNQLINLMNAMLQSPEYQLF